MVHIFQMVVFQKPSRNVTLEIGDWICILRTPLPHLFEMTVEMTVKILKPLLCCEEDVVCLSSLVSYVSK